MKQRNPERFYNKAMRASFGYPKLMPWERKEDKVGRNDPCPCGSRKKWKFCCKPEGKFEVRYVSKTKPMNGKRGASSNRSGSVGLFARIVNWFKGLFKRGS